MLTLLTGGARSGKSRAAVAAAGATGAPVTYLATGQAFDDEMTRRIDRHRAERPAHWGLVEEPRALVDAIAGVPDEHTLIVDCLALWTTNRLDDDDEVILAEAATAAATLAARSGASIVVTNEVGSGIVPENALARRFRDTLGLVNQTMADAADQAFLTVAGQLLRLDAPEHIDA